MGLFDSNIRGGPVKKTGRQLTEKGRLKKIEKAKRQREASTDDYPTATGAIEYSPVDPIMMATGVGAAVRGGQALLPAALDELTMGGRGLFNLGKAGMKTLLKTDKSAITSVFKTKPSGRDLAGNYLHNIHKYSTKQLKEIIDEGKDFIKKNPNSEFSDDILWRINEIEPGVTKDIQLQKIAEKGNRIFFDTGTWNSPSYIKNIPSEQQLGHVTTSSGLWDMVEGGGTMKARTAGEDLFFNIGGEGQLARTRLIQKEKQGGAINLIFDKKRLDKSGVVTLSKAGETTTKSDVSLKNLFPESKQKAKSVLLNEAEFRGIPIDDDLNNRINDALGL